MITCRGGCSSSLTISSLLMFVFEVIFSCLLLSILSIKFDLDKLRMIYSLNINSIDSDKPYLFANALEIYSADSPSYTSTVSVYPGFTSIFIYIIYYLLIEELNSLLD